MCLHLANSHCPYLKICPAVSVVSSMRHVMTFTPNNFRQSSEKCRCFKKAPDGLFCQVYLTIVKHHVYRLFSSTILWFLRGKGRRERESWKILWYLFLGTKDSKDAVLFSKMDYLFVLCLSGNSVGWGWGCRFLDCHKILPAHSIEAMVSLWPCYRHRASTLSLTPATILPLLLSIPWTWGQRGEGAGEEGNEDFLGLPSRWNVSWMSSISIFLSSLLLAKGSYSAVSLLIPRIPITLYSIPHTPPIPLVLSFKEYPGKKPSNIRQQCFTEVQITVCL